MLSHYTFHYAGGQHFSTSTALQQYPAEPSLLQSKSSQKASAVLTNSTNKNKEYKYKYNDLHFEVQ
jgi:hypothetical protein